MAKCVKVREHTRCYNECPEPEPVEENNIVDDIMNGRFG